MADGKRIVKNTGFLYIRMLLVMGVSLFTSRVVLDKLGVGDYALYTVVGGIVGMLSFLNGTLSICVTSDLLPLVLTPSVSLLQLFHRLL